jgi:hypothetical protein
MNRAARRRAWSLDQRLRMPPRDQGNHTTSFLFVSGFGSGAYSAKLSYRLTTRKSVMTRLRYSGASLGFQIGAAIGGLTQFAAATFMAWTGGATWPISI